MHVESVLGGLTGLGNLVFLLGMMYFGFVLMRVRPGRWEQTFFWAAVGQLLGLVLVAAVAGVTRFFGSSFLGGGGVNWAWVASTVCKGLVLLCALVGAVALVGSTKRDQ